MERTKPNRPDGAEADSDAPCLSVIMPVFNEIATLPAILERVRAAPIDKEIVIVDDASTDGSREFLRELERRSDEPNVRLFFHDRNQGKTAAVRTGIRQARGRILIIQDADLEYDPCDFPKLVEPILDGRADVVYGSRFLGSPRRVLNFWHSFANRLLTAFSNAFTNLDLTDMETCYKAFRADILKQIPIRSRNFGFEAEVTAKLARMHCRIYEVPIAYHARRYWEGKKITWRDGVHTLGVILRYSLFSGDRDVDPGELTLRRVDRLRRYNAYLWERMQPFVGQRVLEVGAGTRCISRYLVNRDRVVATGADDDELALLRRIFDRWDKVEVRRFAFGDEATRLAPESFDTVVCADALEYLDDDVGALEQMREVLVDGGRAVLVVPMLRSLHGSIDRALGHKRRYERADLREKLEKVGLRVETLVPFNATAVPAWWLNSRLLQRRAIPGVQARINDLLVPWLRVEERLHLPFGTALLAVGRKS